MTRKVLRNTVTVVTGASSAIGRVLYYINVFAPRLSDQLSRFFRLEGWSE